ncbi:MAG: sensor histidine kinase [Candidatus Dormibacterales bacterium]
MKLRSVAARVTLSALLVSILAVGVVAAGVLVFGASTFERLMVEHGSSAAVAHAMFDETVTRALVVASALAFAGSLLLGIVLGRMIERPLDELALAARQIAAGSYEARVRRPRAPELASVAESFNQMAESLADHESHRRDLIQNFAHELRTPLTNLHGYLAALRDHVLEPDSEVLSSLQGEVARLMRLSRSLDALVADRELKPHPEDMDLGVAISTLLELNRPNFERGEIGVEVDLPSRLSARADPDSLNQVVSNLLQNAARYTPHGGRVWVRAEQQRDSALLMVDNTGPGIPPGDLARVFERFHRVEKSRAAARGGIGVGLAIVKQLVEAAGGQVGAESSPGLTRFWVRLPASAPHRGELGPVTGESHSPARIAESASAHTDASPQGP